jgi:FkbM family methyltransferase
MKKEAMKPLIYYGQNREDIILSAFFKDVKKGFYVDVGACEPIKFSITKLFYEKGWHGINIEPQEREFNKLVADRKRDINLNIGVGEKPGRLKLRAYNNEALSTFSEDVKKKYEHTKDQTGLGYKDKTVEVKTLEGIFTEHKVKSIQFLKVDVEGFEYEVLKGNDWNKYRPEVLCVEANNMVKAQPWQSLLKNAGYIKVFFDGLNEYYVSKEAAPREKQFRQEYVRLPLK